MKRMLVFVFVAFAFMCTSNILAGTTAGESELRIDGAIQNTSTEYSDTRSISGQLTYNHFLSDQFSIGGSIRPMIQTSDPDNGEETTSSMLFLLGRGDLYLSTDNDDFVPYIGAHAGVINYEFDTGSGDSESESVLTYGIQGGIKMFVSENTSFNIEVDLSIYTPESDNGGDEDDVTVTSVLFGYSVYF